MLRACIYRIFVIPARAELSMLETLCQKFLCCASVLMRFMCVFRVKSRVCFRIFAHVEGLSVCLESYAQGARCSLESRCVHYLYIPHVKSWARI